MRMNETHRMCVKSKEKHRNPVGFLNLERLQVRADQKLLDGDHDEEAFFFFDVNQQKSVYSCLIIMIEWWDTREGGKKLKKNYFSNIFILSG